MNTNKLEGNRVKMIAFFVCAAAAFLFLFPASSAQAYWVWSPDTGKFVNPEKATEDTADDQYAYALNIYQEGHTEKAIKELKKLLKEYGSSRVAPEAQFQLGLLLEENREFYEAFEAYQRMLEKYPQSDRINEAIERQYKIGELFLQGRKGKVMGMAILPAAPRAVTIFKSIVDTAPFSEYGDKAQFKLGLAYRGVKQFEKAVAAFQAVIDNYPSSPLVDDAKFEMAQTSFIASEVRSRDQQILDRANELLEEFIEEYPDSNKEAKALTLKEEVEEKNARKNFKIAEYYEKQGYLDSALIYYEDVARNYPETGWGQSAADKVKVLRDPAVFIREKHAELDSQIQAVESKIGVLENQISLLDEEADEKKLNGLWFKKTELEEAREKLLKKRATFDKSKKEDIKRREQALELQKDELKEKQKRLDEKKKLLKTNPSPDLRQALARWQESIDAERYSLAQRESELKRLKREIGLADEPIWERVIPFIGEKDIDKVLEYKSDELVDIAVIKDDLYAEKEHLSELLANIKGRLADLESKKLDIMTEKGEFQEALEERGGELAERKKALDRDRAELMRLEAELEKVKEEYREIEGTGIIDYLGEQGSMIGSAIKSMNPFSWGGEEDLRDYLKKKDRLESEIAEKKASVRQLKQALERELSVSGEPIAAMEEGGKLDKRSRRKVVKRIKALQREIRKRQDSIEDIAERKRDAIEELDRAIKDVEESRSTAAKVADGAAKTVTFPAKALKVFLFGLDEKEAKVTREAEKKINAEIHAERIRELKERVELDNIMISKMAEEIDVLKEELDELEEMAEEKGISFRSLLIEKPAAFFKSAITSAAKFVPKKDTKEALLSKLDKETRELERLKRELRFTDSAITEMRKVKEKETAEQLEEEPATKGAPAVKSEEEIAEELRERMAELDALVSERRKAYEYEKEAVEKKLREFYRKDSDKKVRERFEEIDEGIEGKQEKLLEEKERVEDDILETVSGLRNILSREYEIVSEKIELMEEKISGLRRKADSRYVAVEKAQKALQERIPVISEELAKLDEENEALVTA